MRARSLACEVGDGFFEGGGQRLEVGGGVDVADVGGRGLDLLLDAGEAGGDDGGVGEVGVDVCAGDAAFDAQAGACADDAEASGAVVGRPGERCWGPAAGLEALV